MSREQQALVRTYKDLWAGIVRRLGPLVTPRRLSDPLLLDVDSIGYPSASVKIMIVGQQTFGWGDGQTTWSDPNATETILAMYKKFNLGEQYTASPFWVASRRIYRGLSPGSGPGSFAWTNLLKVDERGYRPAQDVEDILMETFNVLPAELEILRPQVVVFFTGPKYDDVLCKVLPGSRLRPTDGLPVVTLAQVEHPLLPPVAFRTYHPNYLRRAGKWEVIDTLTRLVGRP